MIITVLILQVPLFITYNKLKQLKYVWFLEYTEGKWLLDAIEEGGLSLEIAKMPNVIPDTVGVTV
ncbi:hypothetical protein [Flavobacterium macrobrachii]|uniref:hypothetical protein n=1 Tax=Flavobacterium macrobrachii TaxID=591204 RepID=UPI003F719855